MLSNSRGPEALRETAAEIGCQAAVVTDVPSSSDVVVLTVAFAAAFELHRSSLMARLSSIRTTTTRIGMAVSLRSTDA